MLVASDAPEAVGGRRQVTDLFSASFGPPAAPQINAWLGWMYAQSLPDAVHCADQCSHNIGRAQRTGRMSDLLYEPMGMRPC